MIDLVAPNDTARTDNEEKLTAVRQRFDDWKVDAVLISSKSNRRWLSGFTGSLGYLLITRDKALIATDGRYWQQATAEAPGYELYRYQRGRRALAQFVEVGEAAKVGLEADGITLSDMMQLRKAQGVSYRALPETVEGLREVKTADELAIIRQAALLADSTMMRVYEFARPGVSERELAWQLEQHMRNEGADKLAFDIIVAAGPNGAKPHHTPTSRPLEAGDVLTVDLGAGLHGYHSDLTRSFFLGDQPSERFLEIYSLVEDGLERALSGMRPGMTGAEADRLAREVFEAAGMGDYFLHSLGHGIGLEVHEGPRLASRYDKQPIPVGAVITVEPGLYIDGWSGIRLEELVVMGEEGVELLSFCPRQPLIPV